MGTADHTRGGDRPFHQGGDVVTETLLLIVLASFALLGVMWTLWDLRLDNRRGGRR